jgi:hypothetical protein
MMFNGVAILNNERFLEKCGWCESLPRFAAAVGAADTSLSTDRIVACTIARRRLGFSPDAVVQLVEDVDHRRHPRDTLL